MAEQISDYRQNMNAKIEKAREEMVSKSHQMGVPVIEIDGEIHVGFNRAELERALELNKS